MAQFIPSKSAQCEILTRFIFCGHAVVLKSNNLVTGVFFSNRCTTAAQLPGFHLNRDWNNCVILVFLLLPPHLKEALEMKL